jgi:hypothetical protein
MEEEICMNCKQDNNINILTHCKFCGEPLCKNIWEIPHNTDTTVIIKKNVIKKEFEDFALPPDYENCEGFNYKFLCYKTQIYFRSDIIKLHVKNLHKPLYIKFNDIIHLKLEQHTKFHNYSSLTITLLNNNIIHIHRNNVNLKLFQVLNKFLDFKDVLPTIIVVDYN